VQVTSVRGGTAGDSSQHHRWPGGASPGSAGVQAIRRLSSNSVTWFSRDGASGERHREHVARAADALPLGRDRQVVIAIPARLLGGVSDELEDPLRLGRDLAARADHARWL
jgi:hypothetical protein